MRHLQRLTFLEAPQQESSFDAGFQRERWCSYLTMQPHQRLVGPAHSIEYMSKLTYCQEGSLRSNQTSQLQPSSRERLAPGCHNGVWIERHVATGLSETPKERR